ncbi:cytochrome P450 [Echria macrotheca]|uniref:Cytochrome P450 n=1 Tax=Echria macrotheca TaxID=438768 RepID=A0AAJ0FFF2_9PEZI|nr:cytochrome P450 [Echria macrotheca]
MGILLTAFVVFVAYQILYRVVRAIVNPVSKLPGPWHSKFTSLGIRYHLLTGTRSHYIDEQFKRYGPVVRLEPYQVATSDHLLWEDINRMGTPFRKTPRHDKMRIGPEPFLFSMTDVKLHSSRRKLFSRALSLDVLRKNWEKQIRAKIDNCVDLIKKQATEGTADVHRWWLVMTGDIIALLSFGESFNMVENWAKGKSDDYLHALEDAGVNILLRGLMPFGLSLLARILPFKRLKEIVGANQVVYDRGAIAVENLRNVKLDKPNLFSQMLAAAEKSEYGVLTDDAIRSEAAGMLIAGADTSGSALTYVVWEVLKRPDLQKRLEDEVAKLDPDFTDEDLERLPLMNNVIDEVLRLRSPASGTLLRQTGPGGVVWHGHYIPANTMVVTQQWTMVRDEKLFPDAEKFDETRFEHATATQRRVAQPFGLGARSCIGIHLAKMELRLATAVFFRKCRGARISKNMTNDMMEQLMKFFTYPKGGRLDITFNEELAQ